MLRGPASSMYVSLSNLVVLHSDLRQYGVSSVAEVAIEAMFSIIVSVLPLMGTARQRFSVTLKIARNSSGVKDLTDD